MNDIISLMYTSYKKALPLRQGNVMLEEVYWYTSDCIPKKYMYIQNTSL